MNIRNRFFNIIIIISVNIIDRILKTRMAWDKLYCPWIKICSKDWKTHYRSKKEKNHMKDNIGQIVLPLI